MKLDEASLPALPQESGVLEGAAPYRIWYESKLHEHGLACARAGALAALDELIRTMNYLTVPAAEEIRRLSDTIMEGE